MKATPETQKSLRWVVVAALVVGLLFLGYGLAVPRPPTEEQGPLELSIFTRRCQFLPWEGETFVDCGEGLKWTLPFVVNPNPPTPEPVSAQ